MMSSLDNPVSAYFEVTPTQATIAKNQTCQISYSTISDGKVTFKSSAENIATVDANGLVTAKTAGTAIITVELAATPYYQGATKNVEISVDAVLSIDATEVTVGYGASINLVKDYHLARKGDATINYEIIEGGEFITLDETTKDITGKACGNAKVKVSVPASTSASSDELVIDVKARVQNLAQLVAVIGSGDEPFAYLADGVSITLPNAGVSLSGKKVTIKGDEKKPATFVFGENGIVINDNLTIENVNIDASATSGALIRLDNQGCEKKNQSEFSDAAKQDVNLVDIVTINNVMIKNLKSSIIYSNSVNWAIRDFTITNSIIQLDNGSSTFIRMDKPDGGNCSIKNINITGNTIYNLQTSSSAYFIRFCNANNAGDVWGQRNSTSKLDWNISNNTLIRMFTGKDFGNNIVNVAGVTNTVKDNIFYDVYRLYQYLPKNQVKITTGNYIYWDVTAKQTNDISGSNNYKDKDGNPFATELTAKPFTYPTEALDLTKENGGLNLKPSGAANAGDPRWLK